MKKHYQFLHVALVESHVTVNGKVSIKQRYFISSLPANAEEIARAVRCHWAIENSLHWVLDVTMGGDLSRVLKDNAPENMAMIRHIVLNLLRGAKNSVSKRYELEGTSKKSWLGSKYPYYHFNAAILMGQP